MTDPVVGVNECNFGAEYFQNEDFQCPLTNFSLVVARKHPRGWVTILLLGQVAGSSFTR